MLNKEKILHSVKENDKILVSKVLDKYELSQKTREISFTDFLDLYQQKCLDMILKSIHVEFLFSGGYPQAERKMAVILPERSTELNTLPVEVLNLNFKGKMFTEITHRDVLGAVMSLGIKREKIGDIILNQENCQMIVQKDIAHYIIYNLEKIKNTNVNIKLDDIKSIVSVPLKFREIIGFVPSLRLDCIVEEGFSIPRSEAAQLIKGEKVFVDLESISKPSFEVKPHSMVSVRGMGRLIFEETIGRTKKDRLAVKIKRII